MVRAWREVLKIGIMLAITGDVSSVAAAPPTPTRSVAPAAMSRIGTVDERYQAYNIEMLEVTGGRFWRHPDAAGRALDEADAQIPLELSHPFAELRLGLAGRTRRGGEAAVAYPDDCLITASAAYKHAALKPRIKMKTARRQYAAVHEVELESWNRALAVNPTGVMLGMREVIPDMLA